MTLTGFSVSTRFWAKIAVAALLVGFGDVLFFQWEQLGGHLGFFCLALLAGLVIAGKGVRRDKRAWLASMAAMLFSAAMIYDVSFLAWVLFWIAAAMAALLPASGRFDDGWRWFQRLVVHGVRVPFAPLIDAHKLMSVRRKRPAHRFNLRGNMAMLALPLVGSAIIVTLFAAANPVLAQFFGTIGMPRLSGETIGRMVLWIALFIAAWSLLRPRLARAILPTFDGSGDLKLPGVSVASVRLSLIAFNLLFALQNMMDVAYLSGLAAMPEGITLAQYAHRGAYPLIVTALLAAAFVIVTLRPGSSTAAVPLIRTLVVVWIAQNIMLVGSSILRTVDYIEVYSLTVLRISALVWMVLVAVGLLLICWRLLRAKSAGWLINANSVAAGFVLTMASFVDLGAVAAQWNVRHAKEVGGTGAALDLCYLRQLGGSSLLPLIELERNPKLTPEFRDRVRAVGYALYWDLKSDMTHAWTVRGVERLRQAEPVVKTWPHHPPRGANRHCDGSIIAPPPAPAPPAPTSPTASQPENAAQPARKPAPKTGSALTAEPRQ